MDERTIQEILISFALARITVELHKPREYFTFIYRIAYEIR